MLHSIDTIHYISIMQREGLRGGTTMDNASDLDSLLSKRIRSIREGLGLSQQRLAGLLGVSRVTVSQMEAGKRKLSASDLKRLSDILETPADYLLNPDKEPKVVIQGVRENEEPVQSMRVSVPQEKVDKFKEVLLYILNLSLIHISEPTRLGMISYAVFCLKKKKQ